MGFVQDFKDMRAYNEVHKDELQEERAKRWAKKLEGKPVKAEKKPFKDKVKEAWKNPLVRTGVGVVGAAVGCGVAGTVYKHKKNKDSAGDPSVVDVDDYQIDGSYSDSPFEGDGPDFSEAEGYSPVEEIGAEAE